MKEISSPIIQKAQLIKAVICDVDGVLTDGGIIYDNNGLELKRFNVKDGQIVKYLKQYGILVGVITGRASQVVKNRCEELKMDFHYHGISNKAEVLAAILKDYKLEAEEVAYIGDDINDLPVITKVGLAATPNDGHYKVKEFVDLVLEAEGGKGTLRELGDIILTAKDNYGEIIQQLT
ncbi:KdsC family phosphatase [Roseivirga pacifica]|uniref:KdsC family phosphatase n=1 Tax=Roseivirga pacifica TaxID=1267423 RepID=UPI002094E313|nr:HAD-IIIA family hydrolase [Roseivirga pacifica]MCO6357462.1 HAD-IIIA family hydrolase [Roseivirga pacifica]MCO6367774.1 HAD-IIIA family hydrolase [Roseivirga pacifica]MCO6369695.1 HAD-IIIA family hydrolase [Roseivirga pacifica]MCO6373549.1 HAD-IIIA family hydrolase [Roseivirga pacifica]MCO6377146.1 HAD-IIIA family hydrolase [Roseivirga pacifica]